MCEAGRFASLSDSLRVRNIKSGQHQNIDTPSPGKIMEHQTRHLWGREFDIVERGLNEEQVITYIEELRQTSEICQNPRSGFSYRGPEALGRKHFGRS